MVLPFLQLLPEVARKASRTAALGDQTCGNFEPRKDRFERSSTYGDPEGAHLAVVTFECA